MAEIEALPAVDAARLLRMAAEGRREYAANASEPDRLLLEHEATVLESAARIVEGDLGPLSTGCCRRGGGPTK